MKTSQQVDTHTLHYSMLTFIDDPDDLSYNNFQRYVDSSLFPYRFHRAQSLPCENGKVASDPGVSGKYFVDFCEKIVVFIYL